MKSEGVEAIRELGKELKRIHKTLNMPNVDEHIGTYGIQELLKKSCELNNCLMQIAKRHNGLEY